MSRPLPGYSHEIYIASLWRTCYNKDEQKPKYRQLSPAHRWIHMEYQRHAYPFSKSLPMLLSLSAVGGICAGYGVICCGHIFACGLTGNLIGTWRELLSGNPINGLLRILGIVLFVTGIAAAALIPEKLQGCKTRLRWEQLSIIVLLLCLTFIMLIPEGWNDLLRAAPVFFFAAVQYHSFTEFEGVTASTIFCSNNFRQLTLSLLGWKRKGQLSERHRAKIYSLMIAAYSLGIIYVCLAAEPLGKRMFLPAVLLYLLLIPCVSGESR